MTDAPGNGILALLVIAVSQLPLAELLAAACAAPAFLPCCPKLPDTGQQTSEQEPTVANCPQGRFPGSAASTEERAAVAPAHAPALSIAAAVKPRRFNTLGSVPGSSDEAGSPAHTKGPLRLIQHQGRKIQIEEK